jgi:hypothetical protein
MFTPEVRRTQRIKKACFQHKTILFRALRVSMVKNYGHGSAFFNGERVTTESMSAIALTMKRAVIGVPS